MDFDAWQSRGVDRLRLKRLAAGWIVGAISILSTGAVLAMNSSQGPDEPEEEDVLEVQLAEEPKAEEPEPEIEPEPEPEPAPSTPRPQGPVMPKLTTPTEIPTAAAEETEAKPDSNPYGGAFDPYQYASTGRRSSGTGTGVAETASVKVAAPKAAPTGPVRVTAETNPPVEVQKGITAYPAAAKAAGIEGTVVVKFVVALSGDPTNVQAVSGPEELRAACEEKVKGSKYTPATSKATGQPVAVFKNTRCVFRLKTN